MGAIGAARRDPHPLARRLAFALRRRGVLRLARLPEKIVNLIGPQSYARAEAVLERRRRRLLGAFAHVDST